MADFYKNASTAQQYIKMTADYDSHFFSTAALPHLKAGGTALELGTGPGNDLHWLKAHLKVTASDNSPFFMEHIKANHPEVDVLEISAEAIQTDKTFDAIISNKVLHHLKNDDLESSIKGQAAHLNDGGVTIHTFWWGAHEEEIMEMCFNYHQEQDLETAFGKHFELIKIERYTEIEENDSVLVVAKKK